MTTEAHARFWPMAAFEGMLFLTQTFVFFLVAIFYSHFLASQERLQQYSDSKIGNHLPEEFGFTLLAVVVALGILALLSKYFPVRAIAKLSDEVIQEVPRTIYFFGSTLYGTALAWVVREAIRTSALDALGSALLISLLGFGAFMLGFLMKFGLASKRNALGES